MEKIIISHTDLDGVASAIVAAKFIENQSGIIPTVVFVDYNFAVESILGALESQKYDELWITDLSLREADVFKQIQKHKGFTQIKWIDHHESSLRQDWMEVCIIKESDKECAATLTYKYCQKQIKFDSHHYDYMARYARDVDLCRKKYPRAFDLNMIISTVGPERLYEILSGDIDLLFNFTPEMQRAVKAASNKLEQSKALAIATKHKTPLPNGLSLVSAICSGYPSIVGDILGGDGIIVALVDLERRGISLRTMAQNINLPDINFGVHEIAEHFEYNGRRGGGHPAAAGAYATPDFFQILANNLGTKVTDIIKSISKTKFLQQHAEYIEVARAELLRHHDEMQGAEVVEINKERQKLQITFEKKFDPVRKLLVVEVNKTNKEATILYEDTPASESK